MEVFTSSLQHILAELQRIDLLVRAQVWRAQQIQANDPEFQGLYISGEEIAALLAQPIGLPSWATEPLPLSFTEVQAALQQIGQAIDQRTADSAGNGITLRLNQLAHDFALTPFDVDVLLICLAPEIDLRYGRLFAYLQDHAEKRSPTVELALNLLCPSLEAKVAARQHFEPQSPLMKYHIVHLLAGPVSGEGSFLDRTIRVDERIASYLLDSDAPDVRLAPFARRIKAQARLDDLLLPLDLKQRLGRMAQNPTREETGTIYHLQGSYGVGRQAAAEALCREMGLDLLVIDGEGILNSQAIPFEDSVRLAQREARLQHAALYWIGFDSLLTDDRQAWRNALLRTLVEGSEPAFLAGEITWEPANISHDLRFLRVEFPCPSAASRKELWGRSLNGSTPSISETDLAELAGKFRFTGGQIRDAAATARNLARGRDLAHAQVTLEDIYAACRLQSNRNLALLAQKITPHYTWDDIVLPADSLEQLRELCNQVKHRARVYDTWGFGRKLAMGKGVNALFAGPSGTGKTMAADIIAGELGLDLYKIDLSTVVSKYIGETEKNLSRIFEEAETSNAILFFDEADALFGKRSEVKDAHDRYANIEISYLLQRMEEYSGVVILASNLRQNMDEAFVRRMHLTISLPFPGPQERYQIWQKIWPGDTPLDAHLDLDFLAQTFEMAGGNIRNIALSSAFLAAADQDIVNMGHLLYAIKREYQKMGKMVRNESFGKYAALIGADERNQPIPGLQK